MLKGRCSTAVQRLREIVWCMKKNYSYRVLSVGQLGLTASHTACNSHSSVEKIIFSQFFSSFESGGITKNLITGPRETEFCFPSTLNVFPGEAEGDIEVSELGKQISVFPLETLEPVIKCLLIQGRLCGITTK